MQWGIVRIEIDEVESSASLWWKNVDVSGIAREASTDANFNAGCRFFY